MSAAAGEGLRATGGRAAWEALSRGEGRVLASFRRSIYLEAGTALVCVGGDGIPDGPINLRLHGVGVLPAAAGSGPPRWRYRDGALSLPGARLRLHARATWAPPRPAAGALAGGVVATGLERCRRGTAAGRGGDHVAQDAPLARRVAARLEETCARLGQWLRTAAHAAAPGPPPREALGLLGLGPGLTPSGDDVLVGALVTLHALRREAAARALADAVTTHASERTGRISAAHLAAACRGEAVAPVHDVLCALLAGDPGRCDAAVRGLLGYGQSSGRDALAGIVLAGEAVLCGPTG